ncbi:Uncharacterised protein [Anaerococcus prevotii]|uniref:Uncharacterized protein n=1 Tax=Anaerococcus prevotii (strain ATCC 9321 / DSM 20548 / JCM 6508 / NCTC 11806 / PC1) TaxID=525919 RepID=C7RFQ9_ANAPD|nr:hypothetical protein [Anaerococcus prevotii]ACV28320.1 hypothetical protein Apre_0269 [Anaerococcus prevotii DSM 20548]SUU93875.1 Uncharacterised protein [Anaerococcus prevotii]
MYKEGFGNIPNKDKIIDYLEKGFKDKSDRWIIKSWLCGKTAEKMAKDLGLDPDIALASASLAQIGKSSSGENNFLEGFKILRADSYFFPAKVAISQSFPLKDLELYKDIYDLDPKEEEFIRNFLYRYDYTDYDYLVQYLYMIFDENFVGLEKGMELFLDESYPALFRERFYELEEYFLPKLDGDIEAYLIRAKKSKFPYKLFRD